MAKVELPPYIAAISGRIGNFVYRSRKQPDGSYKTFVYEYRPRTKNSRKKRADIEPTTSQSRANYER